MQINFIGALVYPLQWAMVCRWQWAMVYALSTGMYRLQYPDGHSHTYEYLGIDADTLSGGVQCIGMVCAMIQCDDIRCAMMCNVLAWCVS